MRAGLLICMVVTTDLGNWTCQLEANNDDAHACFGAYAKDRGDLTVHSGLLQHAHRLTSLHLRQEEQFKLILESCIEG